MNDNDNKMHQTDYPALYQIADITSISTQKGFLRLLKFHSILLILGAILALIPATLKLLALLSAFVFLVALALSIFLAFKKHEHIWYSSRALAESVKTLSWKYMMKAPPFSSKKTDQEATEAFRKLLQKLLKENIELGDSFVGKESNGKQISEQMKKVRSMSIKERMGFYQINRINEQKDWYDRKSKYNKRQSAIWVAILVLLQMFAIGSVILRVTNPQWQYWPTDVFVVAAGSVMTWIQVKRFRELASAYFLTAHEIGMINDNNEYIKTEQDLEDFVSNAENAFSREHTQWIARQSK